MLQGYQFRIVHVPGRLNELPDHLSRFPEEEPASPQPTDDDRMYATLNQINDRLPLDEYIRECQLGEEACREDLAQLATILRHGPENPGEEKIAAEFTIQDSIIWRRHEGTLQLYVPETARERVKQEFHDNALAGHPGRDETLRQIQERYYWPRMARDIGDYVRTCSVCAVVKRGALQPVAPLRPQTSQEPWKTISLDVLGPYPKTSRGYQYIIIVEDVFSKWVEAAPASDGRVKTILDFLNNNVFSRWGYPKTIITDNGASFRSNLWQRKMEEWRIESRTSPIYHQQANPVERRVQELKKILRSRADPNHPDRWDTAVTDALFCLRTRANAATGTTPSELLLGYTLRRPGEEVRADNAADPLERQSQQTRSARIERAKRRQITYTHNIFPETRQAATKFQVGDQVLYREPPVRGQPFHPTWGGPWEVTAVQGDSTYEVEKAGRASLIHVNDLRAAIPERAGPRMGRPPPGPDEPPPPPPTPVPGTSQTDSDVPSHPDDPHSVEAPGREGHHLPGGTQLPDQPQGHSGSQKEAQGVSTATPDTPPDLNTGSLNEAGEGVPLEPASSRNGNRKDSEQRTASLAAPESPPEPAPTPGPPPFQPPPLSERAAASMPRRRRRARLVVF